MKSIVQRFKARFDLKPETAPLNGYGIFIIPQRAVGRVMLVEHQKVGNMAGAGVSHVERVHNYDFTCVLESLLFIPPPTLSLPTPAPEDVGKYAKLLANCRNGGVRG